MNNESLLNYNYIGDDQIFLKLKNGFLNNHLSQAVIIHGDKGIGKATFLNYFVDHIFNNFSNTNKNPNNSKHKLLIKNNSHPNLRIVSKLYDEKTKKFKTSITIDQIRLIENFISHSSIYNFPKIIIIDSADDLNINSSNALLKILEEPKKNSYIFLISHQPSHLIPTIRSRCIKFKISKPNFDQFSLILKNIDNEIFDDEIKYLYDLSNGSIGLSIDLKYHNFSNLLNEITEICQKKYLSNEIIQFSNNLKKLNNDQYNSFIYIIKFILSSLLKINLNISLSYNKKLNNKLYELSNYLDINACLNTINYLNEYEKKLYNLNLDKKLFSINLFSKISN
mgnify:CR=1 FL=1